MSVKFGENYGSATRMLVNFSLLYVYRLIAHYKRHTRFYDSGPKTDNKLISLASRIQTGGKSTAMLCVEQYNVFHSILVFIFIYMQAHQLVFYILVFIFIYMQAHQLVFYNDVIIIVNTCRCLYTIHVMKDKRLHLLKRSGKIYTRTCN